MSGSSRMRAPVALKTAFATAASVGTIGAAYVFGGVPPGASPVSEEPAPEAAPAKNSKKKNRFYVINSNGRTIWIADAHRGDKKRCLEKERERNARPPALPL